jgi:hypothetical protein
MYSIGYLSATVSLVATNTHESYTEVAKWLEEAWTKVRDILAKDIESKWARSFDPCFPAMRSARSEMEYLDFVELCDNYFQEVQKSQDFDDANELWYLGELCKVAREKGISTADSMVVYVPKMLEAFLLNSAIHAGIEFDDDPADLWQN